jgi:lipopolysaccharide transport system ATP-binding protein
MGTVIKVENLGKQYRLGEVGTGTLSHDLNRWMAKIRGKEDPFSKVGEANDRTKKGESDYVWALRDVNFEVQAGEVLGIIGRNGAGKSTLLKILSKVTKPTTGQIKTRGRIASLLEVGTGFHPEMTGRENTFLNGAIMGMTKAEVKSKFDEIVDFAGVERYIDTPVKRYSSGMYVRLAFAVAAHLEPEILVIDEVLAVGDAEFQKKCLGKMKDVSVNDGRTVLFVSHNMGAIINLCQNALLLGNGQILYHGDVKKATDLYLFGSSTNNYYDFEKNDVVIGDDFVQLLFLGTINENKNIIQNGLNSEKIGIKIIYRIKKKGAKPTATFALCDKYDTIVFMSISPFEEYGVGTYTRIAWLPKNFLNDIEYEIRVGITTSNPVKIHAHHEISLRIIDDYSDVFRKNYKQKYHGLLRPIIEWENNTA